MAEILMAGTAAKNKSPEMLSDAISDFDKDLCSETFLRELQGVLPNDDDVSSSRNIADDSVENSSHTAPILLES